MTLQEYQLEEANVWFVRFSLDPLCTTLACGNRNGTVLLWDPNELRSQPRAKLRRPASASKMAVNCWSFKAPLGLHERLLCMSKVAHRAHSSVVD